MENQPRWRRYLAFGYGAFAYVIALTTIVYAVGFLANTVVPKSIDSGATDGLGSPLLVNLGLVGLFCLQHSVMARRAFKNRWTRFIPEQIERSTYVLSASIVLLLVMWGWRSLPAVVWHIEGVLAWIIWAGYLSGWILMFAGVVMIDMNDLLGLRQVRAYLHGRDFDPIDFQTPGLYRFIRHPIMTGFLVAFWVTPHMSLGHLVFAGSMTVYILVGVTLEERDLHRAFGEQYQEYRRVVPRFVPRPWRSVSALTDSRDAD